MRGYGGINQIATQRPEPRERAVFVRAGELGKADDVGGEDRGCRGSRGSLSEGSIR